ncbi:MAG: N-acetylmuramoyl-L-alanine amidase-like domain-containing protein [Candidatus Sericytochromatia bacterium]
MRPIIPLFCLTASLMLAAPAASALPVPVTPDEGRFLEVTGPLRQSAEMPDLVARVGQSLIGAPYGEHLLEVEGDGVEPLVTRLDAFDCVTLVETSVAAARALAVKAGQWKGFREELERLRYRDGKRGDYTSRLHYFSEWIADNERRGLVLDLTASLGGVPDKRPLRFMTSHREAYKKLRSEKHYRALQAIEADLTKSPRYVLPVAQVPAVLPLLHSGDIVAIATTIEGLDVVHTGLVLRKPDGAVHLLHAPVPGSRVQVSEKPLTEYLKAYKVYAGIMVARPLAPAK